MDQALPAATGRRQRHALLALLALGVASTLVLAWLSALALGQGWPLPLVLLPCTATLAAGVVAWRRQPGNPAARRLLVLSVLVVVGVTLRDLERALAVRVPVDKAPVDRVTVTPWLHVLKAPVVPWPESGPLGAFGFWLQGPAMAVLPALAPVTVAVWLALAGAYPDGRDQWRWVRRTVHALGGLGLLIGLVVGGLMLLHTPDGLQRPAWKVANGIASVAVLLGSIGGAVLLAARYRRADRGRRAQLAWPLGTALLLVTAFCWQALLGSRWIDLPVGDARWDDFRLLLQSMPSTHVSQALGRQLGAAMVAMSAGILLGLLGPPRLDVEALLRRVLAASALALGLLLAAVAGLAYGGLVLYPFPSRLPGLPTLLLVGAVTVAARPARRRLERLAGRWVFGDQPNRYDLMRDLGAALHAADDLDGLAGAAAEVVRRGLHARWVRLSLPAYGVGGLAHDPAAAGAAADSPAELSEPLAYGGETLGALACGPSAGGGYTAADAGLLATLAGQVALALHDARLSLELARRVEETRRQAAELAAARARIVQAEEAGRRRIGRDIHDGVQQQLVALIASAQLAELQLDSDPAEAGATLHELQLQAREALADLRELTSGIHPAVLTDHGLVEAVAARLSRLRTGARLEVAAELEGARFAEEVEGAAYFTVCEGLANALKHAQAGQLTVRVGLAGGQLTVEVADDGRGFEPAALNGGLVGVRDRVEALGGTLAVRSAPGQGTVLAARLPARGWHAG